MFTADDISRDVGALLNDPSLTRFTFIKQLPYINMAYSELSEQLEYTSVSFVKESSAVITVPQGQTDIGGASGLKVPSDLVSPVAVFEKQNGASTEFIRMNPIDYLPKTDTLTNAFIHWMWTNQTFRFTGATCPIDIKIDYIANRFTPIGGPTDQIVVFNARSFLGFRTGGLVAEYIGENPDRANSLNGNAGISMDRLLGIFVKEMQAMQTRRRPFRSGYKSNSWI
jgi:hypothetical protein